MSQDKNATVILIIASVLLVALSGWNLGELILDFIEYPGYYDIFDFIWPVLWLVAYILLMIGFIMLQVGRESTSATAGRLCGKCGRSISTDDKFCPYCGWKPTTGTG